MDLATRHLQAFKTGDCAGWLTCLKVDVACHLTDRDISRRETKFVEFCAHIRQCCAGEITEVAICSAVADFGATPDYVVGGASQQTDTERPSAGARTCRLASGSPIEPHNDRTSCTIMRTDLTDNMPQVKP